MTTSGVLLGMIPDFMAQKYEGGKLNFRRWGSMTLLSAVNGGIVLRAFYNAVNNAFPEQTLFNIAERTLIDQFIFSPAALFGYIVCANYIEGKSTQDLSFTIKHQYPKTMAACWVYWGMFGCPALNMMPPDLRVITANALSIVWMVFLSNLMHKNGKSNPL